MTTLNKSTAWKTVLDGRCTEKCEAWDNHVWTRKPCTCGFEARLVEAEKFLHNTL